MSNLKPNCPACNSNDTVSEWIKQLNTFICKRCSVTFNPDNPKEHEYLNCPLCDKLLVHQPTVSENYRTATCYGKKKNEDGTISETLKCGYKMTFKDGIVENQEWTGQKSTEKTKEDSN